MGLFQGDLDLGLEVATPPPAPAAAERIPLLELDAFERAPARAEIPEDRAEELREVAEVARLVDVNPVPARAGPAGPPGRPPNPPAPASA